MSVPTRRLAAILAADVVGFSRLIGADEAATLGRLRALRSEVVDPLLAEHGGRVFKTTGDGLLAEFPSAVQALRCAVAIQERQRANSDALTLRIGLHSGDVVVEGDDLLGDGVNIAARVEPLAEPGGIALSARIREDAVGKLDLAFEDIGSPALKNIAQPIQVFRIRPAMPERPALALPDRPSLVVLPFQNMSGDAEQEYFADGMVEDITTALSRIGGLFVIARNSAFTYKGKPIDVKAVGRELGVRYVVEGSVRKAGGRVRITAQLIEAGSATHLWADRFDGSLDDVFDLQDRVTATIAAAIDPRLRAAEIERAWRKPPETLEAYDLLLRAIATHDPRDPAKCDIAERQLRRALGLVPTYALAEARLARFLWLQVATIRLADSLPLRDEAVRLARMAADHGPTDAEALADAGLVIGIANDLDAGISIVERSLVINPNSIIAITTLSFLYAYAGRADIVRDLAGRAERLNPLEGAANRHFAIGLGYLSQRNYVSALAALNHSNQLLPNSPAYVRYRTVCLGLLGRVDDARKSGAKLLQLTPDLTVARVRFHLEVEQNCAYRDSAVIDAICDGLRVAGVPER